MGYPTKYSNTFARNLAREIAISNYPHFQKPLRTGLIAIKGGKREEGSGPLKIVKSDDFTGICYSCSVT